MRNSMNNLNATLCSVLIIEDSPEDSSTYKRFLSGPGDFRYTTMEAARAGDGMKLWRTHRPDCILLDFQLPDKDGLSALRELVKESGADACAVVMLTGTGDTQLAVEAMKAGAHDYLEKGRISAFALRQAVNNAVEKASLRRQLDNQLHRLHLGIKVAGLAIAEVDYAADIVHLSNEAAKLFGFGETRMSIPRERFHSAFHPDDRADLNGVVRAALAPTSDGWFDREFRVVWPGGETHWLKIRKQIFFDNASHPRHAILVAQDITERKLADEQLRLNHDTFFNLIQNAPFGVYVIDSDFRLIQISAGCQKVFRHVQPLLGRNFEDVLRVLWPEPFVSEIVHHFRNTLATGEPYRSADIRKQRGDIEDVESYDWKIERISLPDGRFGVVCYFYDLTEQLQLEEQLRESERRLRSALESVKREQEQLHTILSTLPVGVMVTNPEGGALLLNRALTDTWRGERTLDSRQDYEQYQAWDPETHEPFKPEDWPISKALKTGEPQAEREIGFRRFDGTTGVMSVLAVPIKDENGSIIRGVAVALDITERKRSQDQEQQARAAAEAASLAKDEFLSLVTHELRAPLQSILGFTRINRMMPHDAAQVVRNSEIVERNARIQQKLIDDLMDTARIVSGKLKIEAVPTDLRLVIEDALAVVQTAAEGKRIELSYHSTAEPQPVFGDAARLQQVIWNLLQNAIKFTPEGGRVDLVLNRTGRHIHLIVKDTGKGIEPEFLPIAFNRFSQDDRTHAQRSGGLGLGLALVKHLVEAHGGTVAAASPGKDKGTTFTVSLPLYLFAFAKF